MAERGNARRRGYSSLAEQDTRAGRNEEEEEEEEVVDELDRQTPGLCYSIVLAAFLLLAGVAFFTLTILHATGHLLSKTGAGWGFLVLGLLTFIPGFYHSRIAYYAWRGYEDYDFQSIPRF